MKTKKSLKLCGIVGCKNKAKYIYQINAGLTRLCEFHINKIKEQEKNESSNKKEGGSDKEYIPPKNILKGCEKTYSAKPLQDEGIIGVTIKCGRDFLCPKCKEDLEEHKRK